ncbi:Virginiamycin A acetyltransferase [compost metagenome]
MPPYAVVAGNPGRIVKMRFAPEIVAELLAIRWWDWNAEKIARNIAAIQGADIDALRAAV